MRRDLEEAVRERQSMAGQARQTDQDSSAGRARWVDDDEVEIDDGDAAGDEDGNGIDDLDDLYN